VPDPVLQPRVELPPPLFGIDRLGPEGGLLGIALHPDFARNRQFYLFYNLVGDDGDFIGRVERFVLADDGRSATPDRVILDDLPAGVHHQGGRMHIGPDGMLYVGVGAFDPWDAQDPDTLAGKLLRLDLDGGIPADNPEPGSYVFVSGIRNTQGFDWLDDETMVMVDHGPSGLELDLPDLRGFDEVNVVRAGDNLGWPRVWGCDQAGGLVAPVLSWNESVPPTGGLVYRGDAIPDWKNSFLFTTVGRDFGRHLHRVELAPDAPHGVVSHEVYLFQQYGRLRTVAAAPDGGIYVMTSNCDGRGECPPQGDVLLHLTASR
jgi:glucose/arabinose dehydrogenase